MKIEKLAIAALIPLLLMVNVALADDVTVDTNVSAFITVTANYASVSFGALSSPSANNAAPDQLSGVYNYTVDTNKNYNIQANGTAFSGAGTIAIANLKLDTNPTAGSLLVGSAVALSTSPQAIDSNVAYTAATNYHGWWLTIPSSQPFGAYTTTVTITISNV